MLGVFGTFINNNNYNNHCDPFLMTRYITTTGIALIFDGEEPRDVLKMQTKLFFTTIKLKSQH